nr:hypothetical protein [Tanacetum cinerariifolium]
MVPFIKELGYTRKCDILSEIHTDQMHQPWRTFIVFISRCISGKSTVSLKKTRKFKKIDSPSKKHTLILEEELAKKPKRAKHHEPAKEDVSSKKPSRKKSTGIQIKDTPYVFVSKKKAPAKVYKGKVMGLLSNVALLKAAQLKKVHKRSKQDTHMVHASGSGDGVGYQPKVPDELQDKTTGESRDDDDSNDDNDDDSDDEDEEEYERINEELYGDININLTYAEPDDEDKGDKEMTNADTEDVEYENVIQESAGNQVKDDAQETQKTEVLILSSSISSDYAAKYLNFYNIPLVDTEVVSMLDVNVQNEVPHTSPLLSILVFVIPKHNVINPP